ncbi:hypothetical protein QJR26_09570 [Clostridium baratii]
MFFVKILLGSTIVFIVLILIGIMIEYIRTRNLKKVRVVDTEQGLNNNIKITDNRLRKSIISEINYILRYLNNTYNCGNWYNKRFSYSIISDLEKLKLRLKDNELTSLDVKKIYNLITIVKTNKSISKISESVIFEWEKNYKNT